jgi:hypothetical protein
MNDTEYTKGFKAGYDFGYKDAANENRYNTGVKVGIAYEQDRILELLEERAKGDYKQVMLTPQLIDLIKGKP